MAERNFGEATERDLLTKSLVDLSIESWRFSKTVQRAIERLDATEQGRYMSQVRFFIKKLEQSLDGHGLRIVTFDGSEFDPGLPVVPVNQEDFQQGEVLVVEQTIEPAVMGPAGLLRMGSVVLGRKSL